MFQIFFGSSATVATPPADAYYPPGTRDVRQAKGRGELLSDAPGRQQAKAREPIEAEG